MLLQLLLPLMLLWLRVRTRWAAWNALLLQLLPLQQLHVALPLLLLESPVRKCSAAENALLLLLPPYQQLHVVLLLKLLESPVRTHHSADCQAHTQLCVFQLTLLQVLIDLSFSDAL